MEFHGTTRVIEIGAVQLPWKSMESHGSARVSEIGALWVPWNSMAFHGTARVIEIGALQVPWNCMELHGIARFGEIGTLQVPWNSMELLVSPILAHSKFHGIPRNLFVFNLIGPLVSSILWVLNLDRIPWNLSFQILMKIIFNLAEWINFRKLIITLYLFVSLFHQLMFYYQYLYYTIFISGITHYVSNIIQNRFSMPIETYFDKIKSHGTFWLTFEQHLWLHGVHGT